MDDTIKIRILITDDDEDDRDLFSDAIGNIHLNFPIEFCKNGTKLIDRLNDKNLFTPDIVFLDLNMPIMSGFETLQHIKEDVFLRTFR